MLDRLALTAQPGPRPPLLFRPESLLRLLREEKPSLADVEQLIPWGGWSQDLPEYAQRRGMEWKQLARKVWTLWLATDKKSLPQFLNPRDGDAAIFWRGLPPEAIPVFIQPQMRWILKQEEIYAFFEEEHWRAFVHAWASLKDSWWGDAPSVAWKFIPPEHVRQALRAGLPDPWDHETRRTLWARMPEVFCEEIHVLFKQGQWDQALTQAWAVPPSAFLRVLSSAEEALKHLEGPPPSALSRWLREEIKQRVPGWERAWTVLERLVPTTLRS